ncbi:hypothetical protein ADUPG1_005989 [Aduncisulcus paluster]|uniref:HEAT repeat-containing protein 1 n=1 Tax=Aduncisulcus paluster TaxID=2918883 RepID=A0ABQ5KJG9_9EUKA|nr:hypothetical protein ADUPG1_005989 [Aduncisulcus paluster]
MLTIDNFVKICLKSDYSDDYSHLCNHDALKCAIECLRLPTKYPVEACFRFMSAMVNLTIPSLQHVMDLDPPRSPSSNTQSICDSMFTLYNILLSWSRTPSLPVFISNQISCTQARLLYSILCFLPESAILSVRNSILTPLDHASGEITDKIVGNLLESPPSMPILQHKWSLIAELGSVSMMKAFDPSNSECNSRRKVIFEEYFIVYFVALSINSIEKYMYEYNRIVSMFKKSSNCDSIASGCYSELSKQTISSSDYLQNFVSSLSHSMPSSKDSVSDSSTHSFLFDSKTLKTIQYCLSIIIKCYSIKEKDSSKDSSSDQESQDKSKELKEDDDESYFFVNSRISLLFSPKWLQIIINSLVCFSDLFSTIHIIQGESTCLDVSSRQQIEKSIDRTALVMSAVKTHVFEALHKFSLVRIHSSSSIKKVVIMDWIRTFSEFLSSHITYIPWIVAILQMKFQSSDPSSVHTPVLYVHVEDNGRMLFLSSHITYIPWIVAILQMKFQSSDPSSVHTPVLYVHVEDNGRMLVKNIESLITNKRQKGEIENTSDLKKGLLSMGSIVKSSSILLPILLALIKREKIKPLCSLVMTFCEVCDGLCGFLASNYLLPLVFPSSQPSGSALKSPLCQVFSILVNLSFLSLSSILHTNDNFDHQAFFSLLPTLYQLSSSLSPRSSLSEREVLQCIFESYITSRLNLSLKELSSFVEEFEDEENLKIELESVAMLGYASPLKSLRFIRIMMVDFARRYQSSESNPEPNDIFCEVMTWLIDVAHTILSMDTPFSKAHTHIFHGYGIEEFETIMDLINRGYQKTKNTIPPTLMLYLLFSPLSPSSASSIPMGSGEMNKYIDYSTILEHGSGEEKIVYISDIKTEMELIVKLLIEILDNILSPSPRIALSPLLLQTTVRFLAIYVCTYVVPLSKNEREDRSMWEIVRGLCQLEWSDSRDNTDGTGCVVFHPSSMNLLVQLCEKLCALLIKSEDEQCSQQICLGIYMLCSKIPKLILPIKSSSHSIPMLQKELCSSLRNTLSLLGESISIPQRNIYMCSAKEMVNKIFHRIGTMTKIDTFSEHVSLFPKIDGFSATEHPFSDTINMISPLSRELLQVSAIMLSFKIGQAHVALSTVFNELRMIQNIYLAAFIPIKLEYLFCPELIQSISSQREREDAIKTVFGCDSEEFRSSFLEFKEKEQLSQAIRRFVIGDSWFCDFLIPHCLSIFRACGRAFDYFSSEVNCFSFLKRFEGYDESSSCCICRSDEEKSLLRLYVRDHTLSMSSNPFSSLLSSHLKYFRPEMNSSHSVFVSILKFIPSASLSSILHILNTHSGLHKFTINTTQLIKPTIHSLLIFLRSFGTLSDSSEFISFFFISFINLLRKTLKESSLSASSLLSSAAEMITESEAVLECEYSCKCMIQFLGLGITHGMLKQAVYESCFLFLDMLFRILPSHTLNVTSFTDSFFVVLKFLAHYCPKYLLLSPQISTLFEIFSHIITTANDKQLLKNVLDILYISVREGKESFTQSPKFIKVLRDLIISVLKYDNLLILDRVSTLLLLMEQSTEGVMMTLLMEICGELIAGKEHVEEGKKKVREICVQASAQGSEKKKIVEKILLAIKLQIY